MPCTWVKNPVTAMRVLNVPVAALREMHEICEPLLTPRPGGHIGPLGPVGPRGNPKADGSRGGTCGLHLRVRAEGRMVVVPMASWPQQLRRRSAREAPPRRPAHSHQLAL